MKRGTLVLLLSLLGVGPAFADSFRIAIVNLETGDLRAQLEETVLFSLHFAGLDFTPLVLRPAVLDGSTAPLLAARPHLVVTIGSAGPRLAGLLPPGLPVIATAIGHPEALSQRSPSLVGTSHYVPPARQLDLFRRVVPGLRRLGLLSASDGDAARRLLAETRSAARDLGVEIIVHQDPGGGTPQAIAGTLAAKIDALLLLGDRWRARDVADIVAVLAPRRLPLLAYSEEVVRHGAVAALYADRLALAAEVGPMAKRILTGTETTTDAPIRTPPIFKLALNIRSARVLGVQLPYRLLVIASEIVR